MIRAALVLSVLPVAATALSLDLPGGAERTYSESETGTAPIAVDIFRDGEVPVTDFAGRVGRQVWTIPGDLSTWQIATPLAGQLADAGYSLPVNCETRQCGGFDFRFGIEVVPEPDMHVDLGDFRYIAALKQVEDGADVVGVLVSRRDDAAYVQIVAVEPGAAPGPGEASEGIEVAVEPDPVEPAEVPFEASSLIARLESDGHVVLDDLAFESGSSDLGEGSYESLRQLGGYLRSHPNRSVVVVGHTDAVGGLAGNVALSRRRAGSVRERLIGKYEVPRVQVTADGVGFLAPRATNLTEEGRERNRRVEVVLISTE